jgi:hypothetical protein
VIVAPTDGDIHTFICADGSDRDDWLSKISLDSQEWLVNSNKHHPESTPSARQRRTTTISRVSIPHTVPVAGPKVRKRLFFSWCSCSLLT